MVSGIGPGGKLRHGLAMAEEIHRSVNINQEPCISVGRRLGLRHLQVQGVARMTRKLNRIPSPERLALVVMLDSGLDDSDVAEMFNRSVRWAQLVRSQSLAIRSEDFIPESLEWLDPDFQRDDPTVDEIYRRAAELRDESKGPVGKTRVRWQMPQYLWNSKNGTFLPVGA
jgi:hypothetical protein